MEEDTLRDGVTGACNIGVTGSGILSIRLSQVAKVRRALRTVSPADRDGLVFDDGCAKNGYIVCCCLSEVIYEINLRKINCHWEESYTNTDFNTSCSMKVTHDTSIIV